MSALVGNLLGLLPSVRRGRLLTLIYHRVRAERDPMFPGEVTAAEFDWQMSLLKRYCNPLALREAVPLLAAGKLPPRAVAVTFDDGYRDNAQVALPILRGHGVPATFFIATSFLNGGIMWNDAVIEAVRVTEQSNLDLGDLGSHVVSPAAAARGQLSQDIIGRIKHLPQDERARRVADVVTGCAAKLPRDLMMEDSEVRQLHDAGMEIGAHTRTHPILKTLGSQAAADEIAGSARDLEALVGARICGFAYPNGRPGEDYDERERNLIENLGFQYAMSTRWGAAQASTDRFQLPRFTPWDHTPSKWLARLLLAFRRAG